MNRIREILLQEYIGAIVVALLTTEAFLQLLNGIIRAAMVYWGGQPGQSVLGFNTGNRFNWTVLIMPVVGAVLYASVALLLMWWVYMKPEGHADASLGDQDQDEL